MKKNPIFVLNLWRRLKPSKVLTAPPSSLLIFYEHNITYIGYNLSKLHFIHPFTFQNHVTVHSVNCVFLNTTRSTNTLNDLIM